MMSVIRDSWRTRRKEDCVFCFVRAPRRVAALSFSRIYRIRSRTNYRVPVNERAILLHRGKSWERDRSERSARKVRPRSTARGFARPLLFLPASRPADNFFLFYIDGDSRVRLTVEECLAGLLSDDHARKTLFLLFALLPRYRNDFVLRFCNCSIFIKINCI